MPSLVVMGAQWGDEGKGKITDYLADNADIIVRFQGGDNAGHTVEIGEKQYKLHLIPSGILHEKKVNIIASGVAVNSIALFNEIDYLDNLGIKVTPERLMVSDRAHVIMPYHIELDKLKEKARGKDDIGTTFKGIGPCYTDKYERVGIRICDLIEEDVFKEKLKRNLEEKNEYIKKVLGGIPLDEDQIFNQYKEVARKVIPFVKDTSVEIYKYIKSEKKILFEGAQGMLLDIDYGTYPYVTSSNTTSGGVSSGTGIGPNFIDSIVGVAKAYTTRVGKGPFPTELRDKVGEWIRNKGHEYGVTTGRVRRCGWLDVVILRNSVRVCGLTSIVLTKIDTLAGLKKIKVCVGYDLNGKIIDYIPASLRELSQCKPVYEEFEGWQEDIKKIDDYNNMPNTVKKYVERIEDLIGVKVSILSIGPKRKETIIKETKL